MEEIIDPTDKGYMLDKALMKSLKKLRRELRILWIQRKNFEWETKLEFISTATRSLMDKTGSVK
jgi:hypothetical protein